MSINITDAIFAQAERNPDAIAIIDNDRTVTYRALCHAVRMAAQWFRQAGWKPGHIVGLSLRHNPPLHLVCSLALARISVIQVPVPASDPLPLQVARIQRLGIIGLVSNTRRGAASPTITTITPDPGWLIASPKINPIEDIRASGGDTPWILYETSGTTATPKSIAVTHAMADTVRDRLKPIFGYLPGERSLHLSGLQFLDALRRRVYCLSEGGTAAFPPLNSSTDTLLKWIMRHNVTHISCVPLHLHQILRDTRGDSPRLPFVRILRCGTATLPVSAVRDALEHISPNLYVDYGCTEIGTATVATPAMLEKNPETVGRPLSGIDFEVVDDDNKPVSACTTGQVRMRGSGIRNCYLQKPEPGQSGAFRDGWFYPGDVATIDDDGLVFLKGRSDDVMNFDGIMVGPAEIESVLRQHPAVKEVAAFALPSQDHQDIPAVAVVSDGPLPIRDLQHYCTQRLGVRSPRVFLRFKEIPKNPMGKVVRRRVVEQALEMLKKLPRSS